MHALAGVICTWDAGSQGAQHGPSGVQQFEFKILFEFGLVLRQLQRVVCIVARCPAPQICWVVVAERP